MLTVLAIRHKENKILYLNKELINIELLKFMFRGQVAFRC